MGCQLELVRSGSDATGERIVVCPIGDIEAPENFDDVGLAHKSALLLLGNDQKTVIAIQEVSLKDKGLIMRLVDNSLALKDYRTRVVQTLFGALSIRVPRLARRGSRRPAPSVFAGSHRSASDYDLLRGRIGAFVSFRAAERMISELFPQAVGQSDGTARRRVVKQAEEICKEHNQAAIRRCHAATIDLAIDTTFVRSCSKTGTHHHKILIGVGTNDRGECHKIGAVLGCHEKPQAPILGTLGRVDKVSNPEPC